MPDKPRPASGGARNHLAGEVSPYLQEHASNPVDWYPWGAAAFRKAASEDKPVFLSIGYSSCHWCHVMRKESFEDHQVAQMMNEAFVCVKVDREERPDVDSVYMAVCQMMTGSGGWPLTIVMTPEKRPFFAAAYIPKDSSSGQVGMLQLVPRIKRLWREERRELLAYGDQLVASLRAERASGQAQEPDELLLKLAYGELAERFDAEWGGFGDAPKFPTPHNLMFLLRYWRRTEKGKALDMVTKTLSSMAMGGIFDQVGFGFHRYSTDRRWAVPHFEKMLYDQAMMILAYSEACLATGSRELAQVVDGTIGYLLRTMKSPEGGYCSSEDADSEGEEGKYYFWTKAQFEEALGKQEGELFARVYGVADGVPEQPLAPGRLSGGILHLSRSPEDWSAELGIPKEAFVTRLEVARRKLLGARERRPRPAKDGKVLADWNGLTLAALSRASRALGRSDYLDEASKLSRFILERMIGDDGSLRHVLKGGRGAGKGNLDDYAFVTWGLLELYEASHDASVLESAISLSRVLVAHFEDKESGGFFFTADDAEEILIRQKLFYDGATPSGNSAAAYALARLGHITEDAELRRAAFATLKSASEEMSRAPSGHTMMLCALAAHIGPSFEVVISGERGREDTEALLSAYNASYVPSAVLIYRDPADTGLEKVAPFVPSMVPLRGKAAAYICQDFACKLPTTMVSEMLANLGVRPRNDPPGEASGVRAQEGPAGAG